MDDVVEIALAADRNYFCGMMVTACSIAKHAQQEARLRFNLLTLGFHDEDRQALDMAIKKCHPKSDVLFHDMAGVDLSDYPTYYSSQMAYARLLLPDILAPSRYVVYVDVDVLWMDDIVALWGLCGDVELVGCVKEHSAGTLEMERKWFSENGLPFDAENYFCTGISVYNLDAIRRENAFSAVFEFGRKYHGFHCADQSMMYGVLAKRVALLPDRWQVFPRLGVNKTTKVLHYAGEAPWRCSKMTHMLTDTQLLWFEMCAECFGESRWQSLRRFYGAKEIIIGRSIFLMIFRLPPCRWLFKRWLKATGRGVFNESLPRHLRCMEGFGK